MSFTLSLCLTLECRDVGTHSQDGWKALAPEATGNYYGNTLEVASNLEGKRSAESLP